MVKSISPASLCYSATFVFAVILSCHGPLTGSNAQNAPVTTTPKPVPPTTTTTAAPPSPTPSPPVCEFVDKKPTDVPVQKFTINKTNSTSVCLVAKFAALVQLNQTSEVNGTKVTKLVYLNLGQGKVVANHSLCDATQNVLAIEYSCGQLSFTVKSNSTIAVNSIHGVYTIGTPAQSDSVTFSYDAPTDGAQLFSTQPGFHYSCTSEQTIMVKNHVEPVALEVSHFELEAFRENNTSDSFFRPVQECSLDGKQTNDLVPIAVGACLAALVVIVLIAYFVGRRRLSERSTYESV